MNIARHAPDEFGRVLVKKGVKTHTRYTRAPVHTGAFMKQLEGRYAYARAPAHTRAFDSYQHFDIYARIEV